MDNIVLKKLQSEELTILEELDRICKKHNIKYILHFGTALGAVRHKGFIPWDDDIDVAMTIDNYRKFQNVVKEEIKDDFFFQSFDTEKHIYLFWDKIRKNNTFSAVRGQEQFPIHLGICIDIFPLTKYPLDLKTQKKHFKFMKLALIILETELYKFKFKEVNLKGKIIYTILSLIPLSIRKGIAKKLIYKVYDYDGEYREYVDYSELYRKLFLFPKEQIENITRIEFEGGKYPVPKDYDAFLTGLYGDYMKLPPKKDRVAHGNLILKFSEEKEAKTYE